MKHAIGLRFLDGCRDCPAVTNITNSVVNMLFKFHLVEQRVFCCLMREAVHACAQVQQHFGQPTSLEAGVAGHENSFALVVFKILEQA